MERIFKNKFISIFIFLIAAFAVLSGCERTANEVESLLPDIIKDKSFVYDELETEEGTGLYTLRFSGNNYYLYKENGVGVLSCGSVKTEENGKGLYFSDEERISEGSFSGSAFEEPSVSLCLDGRKMKFLPATETTEYVYLSFLGTFSGNVDGHDGVLIFERWFEWYFYSDGNLIRGTYEIFEDGRVVLTSLDGKTYEGEIENKSDGGFDIRDAVFRLPLGDGKELVEFSYGKPLAEYDADHAMGTYTLSLYPENIFEIHGVDGFLKAFGTLEKENGGKAHIKYFPRSITGDAEEENRYEFEVTYNDETFFFPETTPLLPRSGNVDSETGLGVYWSAGTKLEFIKKSDLREKISPTEIFPLKEVSGNNSFPNFDGTLKASMPSVGKAKPLVILVDFPDFHRPRHVTAQNVERALFSLDELDSLSSFYYISSYGKLNIEGEVYGWYRTKYERPSYDSDSEIMSEAIDYYIKNEGLDLANFDADGDGSVDSLYILWAGNMDDGTGMWNSAYRSTWMNSPEKWGTRVTGYIFVPGSTIWSSVPPLICNTNSLVHETGHLLGLNDYYSYDTEERKGRGGTLYTGGALEGGLGGMDMMDTNIGDHNIFSKWLLGWAEPEIIEFEDIPHLDESKTYEISTSAMAGEGIFIKLKSSDSMYTDLLVIESVAPVLNAGEYSRLKNPAVRILHVENSLGNEDFVGNWRSFGFKYDNSYTSTKYIGILEADGEDSVLNFVPEKTGQKLSYEPRDYFSAGDKITPETYPNTNAYDEYGNASLPTGLCIYIDEIKDDGKAYIRLGYSEPKESLRIEEISPLPQIVPYIRGEERSFSVNNPVIEFKFNEEIEFAESGMEIKVYSDQKLVEYVEISIEGNTLKADLANIIEENKAYTLVIPQNSIKSRRDSDIRNNFNGIYGFIAVP